MNCFGLQEKKEKKHVRLRLRMLLGILIWSGLNFQAVSADTVYPEAESLIYKVIEAENQLEAETYIDLFTEENQNEMEEYVVQYGEDEFFKEDSVNLIKLKKLSDEVGKMSAQITMEELQNYDYFLFYYAELNIKFNAEKVEKLEKENHDIFEDGICYRVYVLVQEKGQWKVMRISTPNMGLIEEAGEGLHTHNEKMALREQKKRMEVIHAGITEESMAFPLSSNSLSYPSMITVYLTKTGNKNYYGTNTVTMNFNHYLRNVVPNEWIVSYYGSYPAYLRAGTMASKMYAWYYSVNPKWNYAPYYADVWDNSVDQNYTYGSYSGLTAAYKSYVDSAISDIRGVAMVNADSNLFEVHYHASSGSYHSGQMSASGALAKAKEGTTYKNILHYYYDCSSYSGKERVTFTSY